MNEIITYEVLQAAIDCGVREFIVCAGSRNSSFVEILRIEDRLKTYYWPEERSGAFFALGRSRQTHRPVAIITTSGTAAGELLTAAMEAHYSGVPLLLITADRPPSFRGSGAPQSAEQVGLFGVYVSYAQDISKAGECNLTKWTQHAPAHLNVCLAEPQKQPKFVGQQLKIEASIKYEQLHETENSVTMLNHFIEKTEWPLVIVSTLKASTHEAVIQFILDLGAPVMLEAISGLREEPRLQHLRIRRTEKVLETAAQFDYPIDGVLRIGGIPTHRVWRDLEYRKDTIQVCAISEGGFSGLSWNRHVICTKIDRFLTDYVPSKNYPPSASFEWLSAERIFEAELLALFKEEPTAEASLMHALSKTISDHSHVYLGNSLPIREWDMAACGESRGLTINANRGVNGIDGQLSTFLGLCSPKSENWAVLGDLTMLYDMAGFWILPQLQQMQVNIVLVNNGGGKIFERMSPYKEMLNEHHINFEPLAHLWKLKYECWEKKEAMTPSNGARLIEVIPDPEATHHFWNKFALLTQAEALR